MLMPPLVPMCALFYAAPVFPPVIHLPLVLDQVDGMTVVLTVVISRLVFLCPYPYGSYSVVKSNTAVLGFVSVLGQDEVFVDLPLMYMGSYICRPLEHCCVRGCWLWPLWSRRSSYSIPWPPGPCAALVVERLLLSFYILVRTYLVPHGYMRTRCVCMYCTALCSRLDTSFL